MSHRVLSCAAAVLLIASFSFLLAQDEGGQSGKEGTEPGAQPVAPKQETSAKPAAPKQETSAKPAATSWPQFNGPRGDNKSPDTGLLKRWPAQGPRLLWKYEKCGIGFSSLAIADGKVFTAGDIAGECLVTALDMNGRLLWTAPNGKAWTSPWPGSRSTPTYNDGLVYHLNAHGQLTAYEAKAGKPVWNFALKHDEHTLSQGGYAESVIIDGNNLICMPGASDEFVVALNKKTGRKVWVSDFRQTAWDRASYTTPLLVEYGGRRHIIYLSLFQLLSLDAQTGKVEWSVLHRNTTEHCEVVAVSPIWMGDGRVFMTKGYTSGSRMFVIDPSGARVKQLWEHKAADSEHAAAVAHGGYIYVPGNYVYPTGGWREKESREGALYCLDAATGKERWVAKIGRCTLTYADGMIYALDEFGKLRLIEANPQKCNIVSELQLPRMSSSGQTLTHPVVFGGRMYIRNHNMLYVYDVKG